MIAQTQIHLAPFQGITGGTFRKIFSRHFRGVDKFFTPFFTNISADSKLSPRKLAELGETFENGVEVVPQVLSKVAEEIIHFGKFCHQLGFTELNWNLGCPYPMVANKKRGSGMLPYPELIDEILQKVMAEIPIHFSVKCRLGYNSAEEIEKLVPIFNQYPVSEITIHARIGKQLYNGSTNLEAFCEAASKLTVPLSYNGDVFSRSDFERLNLQFPAINTWMIGRGLLMDPFLAQKIKGIELPDDCQAHIRRFVEELYSGYRRQLNNNLAVLGILKEYWKYLANSFNDPHQVFKNLKKVNNFEDYEDAISFIFNEFKWIGSK